MMFFVLHSSWHCRSKVGAKFEDKDGAREVRDGKYSLVDLDSFESPPVSNLSKKSIDQYITQTLLIVHDNSGAAQSAPNSTPDLHEVNLMQQ